MNAAWLRLATCSLLLFVTLGANPVSAQPATADPAVAEATDGLIEFTSEEGRFSVRLPAEPVHDKVAVGAANEQHQFVVERKQGVYLLSYQDNPRLEGGGTKALHQALAQGKKSLQETFQAEVLEVEEVTLEDHPGISLRMTIPAAKGHARCVLYLVGTRLYQIMAIGEPAFVASEETTRVIESFTLVK